MPNTVVGIVHLHLSVCTFSLLIPDKSLAAVDKVNGKHINEGKATFSFKIDRIGQNQPLITEDM